MPVKWAAAIRCNNRTYHLGYFDNEIDAARAYDRGAKKYQRRFAALDFPNSATDAVLSGAEGAHREHREQKINSCRMGFSPCGSARSTD
jgi:hypothetical protein